MTQYLLSSEKPIPYTVHRSRKRRRTVSLTIRPEQGLRILAPMRMTEREITQLLQRRAGWISDQFAVIQKQAEARQDEYAEGRAFHYLGNAYVLKRVAVDDLPSCRLAKNCMEVHSADIRQAMTRFYKSEAQLHLQNRMLYWSGVLGVRTRGFRLSNARRLWGSCSAGNSIRINWRILMAPEAVIDYLLVHELCHILHKNHGARFWARVAHTLPDYKARQKTLRALENDFLGRLR